MSTHLQVRPPWPCQISEGLQFFVDPFDYNTSIALNVSELSHLSKTIFLCPCVPILAQWIVFSVNVFHKIDNLRNWTGYLLFPPGVQGLLYLTNLPSVLLPQRMFTIDLVTHKIIVTTQMNSKSTNAKWTVVSALFLRTMDSFTLSKTFIFALFIKCTFHFSCSHQIFFACPFRSNFIPHISTIGPSPLCVSTLHEFQNNVPIKGFHHFVLLHL